MAVRLLAVMVLLGGCAATGGATTAPAPRADSPRPSSTSSAPVRPTPPTAPTAAASTRAAVPDPGPAAAVPPGTRGTPGTTGTAGTAGTAGSVCRPGARPATVTVGGRVVLLAAPTAAAPGIRLPLVVALHGYDQQAGPFAAATGITTGGTAAGALVAVPQGLGSPAGWNVPDSPDLGPSDVAFLGALLDVLVRRACADPGRVVLTGLSDGADMAVTAACALGPARVRAVLLVAASTGPSPRCQALGVLQVHGTADPVDAYTGRAGDTRRGFGSVKAAGAEQAFGQWSTLSSCTGRVERPLRDLRVLDGTGCSRRVRLVAVQGGGHTWPGGRNDAALGRTTTTLDSTALVRDALAR